MVILWALPWRSDRLDVVPAANAAKYARPEFRTAPNENRLFRKDPSRSLATGRPNEIPAKLDQTRAIDRGLTLV
jgi:hypothetical protein